MATDAPGFQDAEFGVDGIGEEFSCEQRESRPSMPQRFSLPWMGGSRTVSTYRLNKRVFLQGDPARFFPLTLPIDQALKAASVGGLFVVLIREKR